MTSKTLYVSDLDGTLLNRQKQVTKYTADTINQCVKRGMNFTVATARMPYGCDYRLRDIRINTPGILTNGVFLYDFEADKIIAAEEIPAQSAETVVDIFQKNGLSCFVYTYSPQGISICYGHKKLEEQTQYYSDRAIEKCAQVELTENLKGAAGSGKAVYITYTGEKKLLEPVCRDLDRVEGIAYSFYLNVYNGLYCLEVFSQKASKRNALLKLKEMTGCSELVVFGDNLNDISMIGIADRSYAPKNALHEVKEMVTQVLADCDHDGVARFLAEEWEIK